MEVYTAKEVADILKISYRKVLDLIKKGELEAKRVGKAYRITDNQIKKYLEGGDSDDSATT
ncbi:MAG: helix-turn-helix domain-containing protein [Halarsenatibacteraceae bacterium]